MRRAGSFFREGHMPPCGRRNDFGRSTTTFSTVYLYCRNWSSSAREFVSQADSTIAFAGSIAFAMPSLIRSFQRTVGQSPNGKGPISWHLRATLSSFRTCLKCCNSSLRAFIGRSGVGAQIIRGVAENHRVHMGSRRIEQTHETRGRFQGMVQ